MALWAYVFLGKRREIANVNVSRDASVAAWRQCYRACWLSALIRPVCARSIDKAAALPLQLFRRRWLSSLEDRARRCDDVCQSCSSSRDPGEWHRCSRRRLLREGQVDHLGAIIATASIPITIVIYVKGGPRSRLSTLIAGSRSRCRNEEDAVTMMIISILAEVRNPVDVEGRGGN
jgi:hypothetical protein